MANPGAEVTTASTIAWSSGEAFNGYVLAILALPQLDGANYPQASAAHVWPKLRVPVHFQVPIEAGVYDKDAKLLRTDEIEPPGAKYTAFFFDLNDVLIATGQTLFTIEAATHTLNPPALTAPAAATSSIQPEEDTSGEVVNKLTIAPTIVDLTGTKDSVNTAFTIPVTGTIGAVQIFWNSAYQEEGVGYTRTGTSITMTTAPDAGDSLEATVWV